PPLRLKLEVPQARLLGQRALTAHNPRVTDRVAGADDNEGEARDHQDRISPSLAGTRGTA
ncbi:MAG TPA: hypothetical protein VFE59_33260, partial [Trebonia sp.]|nr:hypothetical protein [Trebonia sp.]